MLLIVTQCGGRYCTKLVLILFAIKKGLSISVLCVASRAGKIRFSGEQKSVLHKASSGERGVPRNFVPLLILCLPHRVSHLAPNGIDFGKENVEINSGTAVFIVVFFFL